MTTEQTATPDVPPAEDGAYPDWNELAPRERSGGQRWVVAFVASVDLDDPAGEPDELPAPHRAAAEALDLIRGQGSSSTTFAVWDRHDRTLHHLPMSAFDPDLLEFAQLLQVPDRHDVDAPALREQPPAVGIVAGTPVAEYDVDGVKVLVARETRDGGEVRFSVTASFWAEGELDVAPLTGDEALDHEPGLDEVRALMVNHIQHAAEQAADGCAADGAGTAE